MEIISLSNHIVRKALQLSLNEMAVLCDIKQMSRNPEYGYTCIKSKDKIAEWLDLSRTTVFNAINALEAKGYIERKKLGLSLSQFIIKLDMAQEEIGLILKSDGVELRSKKLVEYISEISGVLTVQNLDGNSTEFGLSQYKICTQDIQLDIHKDIQLLKNIKKENKKSFKDWSIDDFKREMAILKPKYMQDIEELKKFYEWAIEPSPSGKMRLQLEKTWDTELRFKRWIRRNKVSTSPDPVVSKFSERL